MERSSVLVLFFREGHFVEESSGALTLAAAIAAGDGPALAVCHRIGRELDWISCPSLKFQLSGVSQVFLPDYIVITRPISSLPVCLSFLAQTKAVSNRTKNHTTKITEVILLELIIC